MLESHKIPLIEGTVKTVVPREGVVAQYVEKLLAGEEDSVAEIGYKGINKEL
jgi:hypothetical protein